MPFCYKQSSCVFDSQHIELYCGAGNLMVVLWMPARRTQQPAPALPSLTFTSRKLISSRCGLGSTLRMEGLLTVREHAHLMKSKKRAAFTWAVRSVFCNGSVRARRCNRTYTSAHVHDFGFLICDAVCVVPCTARCSLRQRWWRSICSLRQRIEADRLGQSCRYPTNVRMSR